MLIPFFAHSSQHWHGEFALDARKRTANATALYDTRSGDFFLRRKTSMNQNSECCTTPLHQVLIQGIKVCFQPWLIGSRLVVFSSRRCQCCPSRRRKTKTTFSRSRPIFFAVVSNSSVLLAKDESKRSVVSVVRSVLDPTRTDASDQLRFFRRGQDSHASARFFPSKPVPFF